MEPRKRSFFERLTGSIRVPDEEPEQIRTTTIKGDKKPGGWMAEESEEAELAVDVYQTGTDIIVQTMVAGVKPEDLEISVERSILTIRGKREENRNVDDSSYFLKELYWGKFSRSISLPHEVEPEEVDATERHGLLTVRVQKVDKEKKNSVRVKSI
ncbi:hypothetical protein A3I95_01350 [Candidatus Nomurabacteria bacterium RIFCSPLOWO2_02_FULL_44_12]|uniref:SHSP domain-containing protein n=1 Tax=Candidatus Nomurabacteria bacterium RIFCSPLOWO2_12_FULL_44_11 TaxID=1801796 RepID=A0A1F6Y6Y5_9BACT|nr:MAG: hypothetical protein A3E95_01520 [Candidatus Nomurabacteria bacterium RIFCSPHIGHO2_12_FULL_44_22b]OGJ02137.1 MAG: hypothetical protein A3G53_00495 [Candidatus Nomurabacteria bacterium RIFCSPLOWO2_12_FULL_44_11]OGJ08682.1 MAG: hypothetical protein A3I95_01350 [Candidatus Nomurabacteria bacterium RIFCSPLOWO2_02_FULL_44_12]